MKRMGLILAYAASFATCAAQTPARPEPAGSVTGRVLCADTQRPARLAGVKLVRIPTKDSITAAAEKKSFTDGAPAGNPVETSLDGSYIIRNVKPGNYYVVVDKDGYLLPLNAFSLKDLADTSDEARVRVAKSVHAIQVVADQVTREDVVIERGASVGGTVLYDDGSPAAGIGIMVLAKDKDGKWQPIKNSRYRTHFQFSTTDDLGHYRVTGLPPGEYATQANLALNDHEMTSMPMGNGTGNMMQVEMTKTRFSLPLYSGDVFRKLQATGYNLGTGEVRAGSDLIFPLAKLHKVGGQVVAKDGHAVNGGKVSLLYADDKSEMTEADIQYADSGFHLEFVPEGDFLMKVSGATDVTKFQVESASGVTPRFHEESKTIKTYGDAEQALLVKGDTSDVLIAVPEPARDKDKPATK